VSAIAILAVVMLTGSVPPRQTATIELPNGRTVVVTLEDAEQIRTVARQLLIRKHTKLPLPESASIDYFGTVRMGEWTLGQSLDESELSLTYPTYTTDAVRRWQAIRIKKVAGRWRALGISEASAHRTY